MNYSRSKILAWYIIITTTLLTAFAIYRGLEGVASSVFATGVGSGVALYGVKIHNLRKEKEIK